MTGKTDQTPAADGTGSAQRADRANWGLRIASGLALAMAAVLLLWWGLLPFALTVLAVVLLMSWEWGRVVRDVDRDAALVVHAGAASSAVVLAGLGQAGLGLLALVAGTIIVFSLNFGRDGAISALGVPYVGLPALSLLWLRSDPGNGFTAALFVLVVVWVVDTCALIGGRAIGGPRLWPRISPGKTWAGLVSGVAAGLVAGAIFARAIEAPIAALMGTALVLAVVSQMGDLAESALKRGYGVKDSSHLIPGHGGFLDRLDGVVAAAIVAGLIALAINAEAPGRALLYGY